MITNLRQMSNRTSTPCRPIVRLRYWRHFILCLLSTRDPAHVHISYAHQWAINIKSRDLLDLYTLPVCTLSRVRSYCFIKSKCSWSGQAIWKHICMHACRVWGLGQCWCMLIRSMSINTILYMSVRKKNILISSIKLARCPAHIIIFYCFKPTLGTLPYKTWQTYNTFPGTTIVLVLVCLGLKNVSNCTLLTMHKWSINDVHWFTIEIKLT